MERAVLVTKRPSQTGAQNSGDLCADADLELRLRLGLGLGLIELISRASVERTEQVHYGALLELAAIFHLREGELRSTEYERVGRAAEKANEKRGEGRGKRRSGREARRRASGNLSAGTSNVRAVLCPQANARARTGPPVGCHSMRPTRKSTVYTRVYS